jgi:PHD/YefM family antitoxin component YafN of YafNO toxin-antitoxin module
MSTLRTVQFISEADGTPVAAVVPIDLWRQMEAERETAYLLTSKAMRKRLLEAKARRKGMSLEEVRAKLGV